MSSVAHLHVPLCILLRDIFILHHLRIDLSANGLKILMNVVMNLGNLLLGETVDALSLLLVLNLFPHVVADSRPNLLVHRKVLLRRHLRRDLVGKGQLLDVLVLKEVNL